MSETTVQAAHVGDKAGSEARTLAKVSVAHLISHLYVLVFVPILPDLKALLGVSYADLAVAFMVLNIVSAATQAPIGFMCDRVGARALLVAGLLLGGGAFIAVGVWPSYPVLIAAAAAIGLANAVYHPADYAILAAEMSAKRMGRAFSVHTFMGYLGFAIAPPLVLGAAALVGPRGALVICGLLGPLAALPFLPDLPGERRAPRKAAGRDTGASALQLLTPAVFLLTLMFTIMNLGTGIIQTYMIVALRERPDLARGLVDQSLTVWMWTLAAGVLCGGYLADRVASKSLITSGGFGAAALLIFALGKFDVGPAATMGLIGCAGFLAGIIAPSRDMLTRAASPANAVGRVFGIVTTGFNIGGMIGPFIGAWFMDRHAPEWVFYSAAIFMLATIALAIKADMMGRAQAAQK